MVVFTEPRTHLSHLHFSEYIIVLLYTKTVRNCMSRKMMIFNSFTVANDYSFVAHMTERRSNFSCRQIKLLKALAEKFPQKKL